MKPPAPKRWSRHQRSYRRTCARRLLFEPLEDRYLLSGGTLSLDIAADSIAENAGAAATTGTVSRSFLYTLTDLGTIGERESSAKSINNLGEVVGTYGTDAGLRAFIYDGSAMLDLGTLGGAGSDATDINDNGQVVGWSYTDETANPHAFLYDGESMTPLGTFGGSQSYAYAINNAGQIAGFAYAADSPSGPHAFRYENGNMIDLGTLGGPESRGYGINEHGHVVGTSHLNPNDRSHVLYHDGSTMLDLGTLGNFSETYDVNDAGKIVGLYGKTDGHGGAFLYDGDSMIDLGDLGYTSAQAWAINEHDQIVG